MKMQSMAAVRASISFPPALYETLEDIAKQKKVSLSWVVRDAAEKYIASNAKQGIRGIVTDYSAQRSACRTDR
jgi:metal-responsive CopG/Arc/MetJ family transcriptional regulator